MYISHAKDMQIKKLPKDFQKMSLLNSDHLTKYTLTRKALFI